MHNNSNLDFVNIYVYTKFDEILSIPSQDIEMKRNSDNFIKGRNSVTNLWKMTVSLNIFIS